MVNHMTQYATSDGCGICTPTAPAAFTATLNDVERLAQDARHNITAARARLAQLAEGGSLSYLADAAHAVAYAEGRHEVLATLVRILSRDAATFTDAREYLIDTLATGPEDNLDPGSRRSFLQERFRGMRSAACAVKFRDG